MTDDQIVAMRAANERLIDPGATVFLDRLRPEARLVMREML